MVDSMKEPLKRDWLTEAHKIFKGEKIAPKKQHIVAAMEMLIGLSKDTETLKKLMKQVFMEASTIRKAKGLPAPPIPPGLDKEVKLPWN